jgi:hypothetical protein
MPADSFVAPKTNAGFLTYASEAVSLFADAATRPLACSSGHRQRFGQIPPLGQLEEVVDGADDSPLGAHFFEAAQQELAETTGLLICPNTGSGSCLRSR